MPTATETRNGAQTAVEETTKAGMKAFDETAKAGLKAFDALTSYYLAAFDAGLKIQARAIETGKLVLDESAAFQRANRKLAEELTQSARKAQQEILEAGETNLRAVQSAWFATEPR